MGPFRLSKEMRAVDTVARMVEGQTIWGLTLVSMEYQAVIWMYVPLFFESLWTNYLVIDCIFFL